MNLSITKLSHSEPIPMDLLLLADPSEEMISKYLYSGESYLAKIGEEIIGAFILLPISTEEIELKSIAVYSQHQNKGYGKEMFKYAIRIARMEAYKHIIIKTADCSDEQINAYKRMKFEHETTVKSYYIKYYSEPIIINDKEACDQFIFRRVL